MNEKINKQRQFIIQFLYWAIILAGILCFGKYIFPVLIPFFIAFVIACILKKPIQYISAKSGINRKIIAFISIYPSGCLFYILQSPS